MNSSASFILTHIRRTLVVLNVLLWAIFVCPIPAEAQRPDQAKTFVNSVRPFLKAYCINCHSGKKPKGERRFDTWQGAISSDNDLVDLQDVLDQLNLGEMPPVKEKQPADAERRLVIKWLTDTISEYHRTHEPARQQTVLRRLNAREYRNTVRDLLKIELTMFDPAQGFPRDQKVRHLDNQGESLVTSGYLLERYLSAAEKVVEKAVTPLVRPTVRTWTFQDNFQQQPEIDQVHRKTSKFEYMTLFEVRGADKHEGAYGAIRDFVDGVPHDGMYEIRFEAEALNREHQYDHSFLGTDPTELLRLGIVPGHKDVGELHHTQPIEPLLSEIELADGRHWYTTKIWLDAGWTPRFTFENGSMDVRSLWSRVLKKYPKLLPKPSRPGIVEARFLAIKHGQFPQIRIHEFEITGPLYDEWPTPGHRAVLGADWETAGTAETATTALRPALARFMNRAYRRPVRADEIDRIVGVIDARRESGRTLREAYSDGLKAVLCSPAFLYLEEAADDQNRLTSWSLASRLSYFLWASMPDAELMSCASDLTLLQPEILKSQTERLLRDPRSDAFIHGFLASWLTLSDLGATPPDRSMFPAFYHYDLDHAMREETQLFTRHLLENNLPVSNFLDSDITFVNKPLARHYGIEEPEGHGFQKVILSDKRRGGLLGQASLLTVTANGIDTSPVVRGVWLLKNILGTPPSPPPPDVEPLDPDIRGAGTIRDQLNRHRTIASCNDCHRKIDPLGFALENFDPVGGWRTSYDKRGSIDPSGEFPDGRAFENIQEFKSILLGREQQFVTALTTKLISYSSGRQTTSADRGNIDMIVRNMKTQNGGFRDLVIEVIQSDLFQAK